MSPSVFDGHAPSETHEHFDASGNLTGTTRVTREPDWDEYARAKALDLLSWEAGRCPSCGNYDTLVPADPPEVGPAHVSWPEGKAIKVHQLRCLACGSVEIVRRDWTDAHSKDQTIPGQARAADGRIFVARPLTDD